VDNFVRFENFESTLGWHGLSVNAVAIIVVEEEELGVATARL
jgi:hypothetical protein